MLQLVANTEDAKSTSVAVRWCVGRDTLAKLQEKKALNPHLLLVVVKGGYEEGRKLVPMDQMMEYVDFRYPGMHKVFATIVWDTEGNIQTLRKMVFGGELIGKDGYKYSYNEVKVIDGEGNLTFGDLKFNREHEFAIHTLGLDGSGTIEIDVAEEFFAKPPSRFERFWVNFWFERKAYDQCQFRRRRVLAYSVQPLVVLPYLVAKLLIRAGAALLLILLGKRGLDFRPIIHPWAMDNYDLWRQGRYQGTIFTKKENGNGQPPVFLLFVPLVHIVVVGIASSVFFFPGAKRSFWESVAGLEAIFVAMVAFLYFLIALTWLDEKFGDSIRRVFSKTATFVGVGLLALLFAKFFPVIAITLVAIVALCWLAVRLATTDERNLARMSEEERREFLLERERSRYQQEAIACNGPMVARYDALPQEKRTFYLRYREIKAKVCKQFAG